MSVCKRLLRAFCFSQLRLKTRHWLDTVRFARNKNALKVCLQLQMCTHWCNNEKGTICHSMNDGGSFYYFFILYFKRVKVVLHECSSNEQKNWITTYWGNIIKAVAVVDCLGTSHLNEPVHQQSDLMIWSDETGSLRNGWMVDRVKR